MHSQNVRRFSMWMSCLLLPALAVAQSTLHVPGDYSTIAAAVAAANDGDTVEIAAGTYHETDLLVSTNLTIRGAVADSGAVVLNGDDFRQHLRVSGGDSLRLENLTLYHGRHSAFYTNAVHGGGSIHLINTDLSAINCWFVDNHGYSRAVEYDQAGGAILATGTSEVMLRACRFYNNRMDGTGCQERRFGGAVAVEGNLSMIACTFSGNYIYNTGTGLSTHGGAVSAGSINAINCLFEDNQFRLAGGTYTFAGGTAVHCSGTQVYESCVFRNNDFVNSATVYGNVNGSALWSDGPITAVNSVFADNITYFRSVEEHTGGSAIRATDGSFSNCTFYGNGSAVSSASQGVPTVAVYIIDNLDLTTSVFSQNIDAPVYIPTGGLLDVSCTDVVGNTRGNWTGSLSGLNGVDGNFSADPLYADLSSDDLSLLPGSPCLAGNNSCGALIGHSESAVNNGIRFESPYPSSMNGIPIVTGEDGVAITIASISLDLVDANSLCMRVDYDGDGFDEDAREQWQSLTGYYSSISIRVEETLAHLDEISESDVEVEFGAHLVNDPTMCYASLSMHVDRLAPEAISLSILNSEASELTLGFNSSQAADFASYQVLISTDDVVDESDTIWSLNEDANLAVATTTQTTIDGLDPCLEYWLAIRVLDLTGYTSELSNIVLRSGFHELQYSDPFPVSESGLPCVNGDEGVAISLHSVYGDNIDASTLQMRVDYDGDGFGADPREQWYALTGYTSADSIRVDEQLPYLTEISESDVEVQFSASLLGYTQVFSTSIAMHVDRVAPAGVSLAFVEGNTVSATLGFDSSLAADFACYQVLVSSDSTFDASDRIWSFEEDPALATATTTQTTVADLTIASQYWFAIQVIDQVGNLSELSNTVQHFTALTGDVLHVPGDFATIESAIAASTPGSTIEIAAGNYNEHNLVLSHSLVIRGAVADSGAVVLDAQGLGHHFYASDVSSGFNFENLCLVNGIRRTGGGSMYISNSPLSIENCDFVNNQGHSFYEEYGHYGQCHVYSAWGGALRVSGSQTVHLSDCCFHSNCVRPINYDCYEVNQDRANLGGAIFTDGLLVLENCRFVENQADASGWEHDYCYGGAVCAASIHASASRFHGNSTSPCDYPSNPLSCSVARAPGIQTYIDCVFTDNYIARETAPTLNGGLLSSDNTILLEGCVFASNTAYIANRSFGGGLIQAADISLVSCTLYDNATVNPDGTTPAELINAGNSLDVQNSIFFANADSIASCPGTTMIACNNSYGNTLGNWTGSLATAEGVNGNFSQNPAFCNAPTHDFGLQAGSPCLPENNSCAELIGAKPQGCEIANSIVFTLPFPSSESGLPIVTGEEGVAITVSSTSGEEVDASSLCMRVDYDGDGFDADAREQWQSLSGYSDDFSIRMEEALAHIDEVSENDIEVEFGARTTAETELSYTSILMHIDRLAPEAVVQSPLNDLGDQVELHFTASSAADFASYRIWISNDAAIDDNDRIWSTDEDPALATAATTQTTVTSLVEGIAYWFAIAVLDEAGNVSGLSNLVVRTGASGNVLCVPASYASLSDALAASAEGDIILLAPGTYYSQYNYMQHNLTIQGESADSAAVIIDAGNSRRHFTFIADSLSLINLTLINGRRTESHPPYAAEGGSVYFRGNYFSAENCVWYNNTVYGQWLEWEWDSYYQPAYGGALFLEAPVDSSSTANLVNCRLYNSTAHGSYHARGGAINTSMPLHAQSCRIANSLLESGPDPFSGFSSTYGGGIYSCAPLVFINCDLANNTLQPHFGANTSIAEGGAIYCEESVILDRCRLHGSTTHLGPFMSVAEGLAVYSTSTVQVNNCLIYSNTVELDGYEPVPWTSLSGLVIRSLAPALENCTFYENAVLSNEGPEASLVFGHNSLDVENCLFSSNAGQSCPLTTGGTLTVSCTDIYGNSADWTGDLAAFANINGNLSLDPLYVNAPDDLHLQAASPCLPGNNSCGVMMGALGAAPAILTINDLTAVSEAGSIELSWSDPDPGRVSFYEIHVGDTWDFTPNATTLIATVTSTQFSFTPASPDCVGYLRVVVVSTQ